MAFSQHWGFEVSQVVVPVDLRYGRHDVFVPPAHGTWLAGALPHAQVTYWEDHGHVGDASVLDDLGALVAASRCS